MAILKLKEIRENRKLTQKELAIKIGVKSYIISNWEQGRTEPDLKALEDLSKALNVTTDYLLGINENRQNNDLTPSEQEQLNFVKEFIIYKRNK